MRMSSWLSRNKVSQGDICSGQQDRRAGPEHYRAWALGYTDPTWPWEVPGG
jgi:hypothetical protein